MTVEIPLPWDGHSPINGELVTSVVDLNGKTYATTPSGTYFVFDLSHVGDGGTEADAKKKAGRISMDFMTRCIECGTEVWPAPGECPKCQGPMRWELPEHPICRLQLPDGTVPTDNVSALVGWKRAYDDMLNSWAELKARYAVLKDWQATVTVSLGRAGGALFDDVPSHIRELRDNFGKLADAVAGPDRLSVEDRDMWTIDVLVREAQDARNRPEPPSKREHTWQFYGNGTFCTVCGTSIGSGLECRQ